MASVMNDARSIDCKLPDLPMLAANTDASKRRKLDSSALRQVGKVSDEELDAKGFQVGAIIEILKTPDTKEQFQITSLNSDGTTINIMPISAGKTPEKRTRQLKQRPRQRQRQRRRQKEKAK